MDDVIREFLLESHENLANVDRDLLVLERFPSNNELIQRLDDIR